MTVSSNTWPVPYNCDGMTNTYAFTSGIAESSEVQVILTDSSGAETVLTETTHYTVSATNNDFTSGGTVTTVSTYAVGNTITLRPNIEISQETDFVEGMPTLYESFEAALDKQTRIAQQFNEKLTRVPMLPRTSTIQNPVLPEPGAGSYIGWNNAGTGLENKVASTITLSELSVIGDYSDSLNTAVATIGSTPKTLVVNKAITLTASVTVPATLHLWITREGSITTDGNVLTLNCRPTIETVHRVFIVTGASQILFGSSCSPVTVYPNWFKENDGTDMNNAKLYALQSLASCPGSTLKLLSETYEFSYLSTGAPVNNLNDNMTIEFSKGTVITNTNGMGNQYYAPFHGVSKSNITMRCEGSGTNGAALALFLSCDRLRIYDPYMKGGDVAIADAKSLWIGDCDDVKIYDPIMEDINFGIYIGDVATGKSTNVKIYNPTAVNAKDATTDGGPVGRQNPAAINIFQGDVDIYGGQVTDILPDDNVTQPGYGVYEGDGNDCNVRVYGLQAFHTSDTISNFYPVFGSTSKNFVAADIEVTSTGAIGCYGVFFDQELISARARVSITGCKINLAVPTIYSILLGGAAPSYDIHVLIAGNYINGGHIFFKPHNKLHLTCSDNDVYLSPTDGISSTLDTPATDTHCSDALFSKNRVVQATRTGIFLVGFDKARITGGEIIDCNTGDNATAEQGSGIAFNSNSQGALIDQVRIANDDPTTGHMRYGISFSTDTPDYKQILGKNDIAGMETAPYLYAYGAAPTTGKDWTVGDIVKFYNPAASNPPGCECIFVLNTTLDGAVSVPPGTAAKVVSGTDSADGDIIGVMQDSGTIKWTTIASGGGTVNLVLTAAVTASASGNAVHIFRMKAEANLAA